MFFKKTEVKGSVRLVLADHRNENMFRHEKQADYFLFVEKFLITDLI